MSHNPMGLHDLLTGIILPFTVQAYAAGKFGQDCDLAKSECFPQW
jgi:hypothetical protein